MLPYSKVSINRISVLLKGARCARKMSSESPKTNGFDDVRMSSLNFVDG